MAALIGIPLEILPGIEVFSFRRRDTRQYRVGPGEGGGNKVKGNLAWKYGNICMEESSLAVSKRAT